jgi:sugar-specific transcriptional regulator TrmB
LIESEIQIFFLGLENGALTIAQLAQLSKMNRITVHEIVRRLIRKGLFLETYSGKKRLVYPNQVDALERLIEQKKFELQQLEKEAKKAANILRAVQTQSEQFPKTRFYKGQEGIHRMLSEIKQDLADIAIMSDGQHFYELIDNDFLEQSLELRNKKNVHFSYTQGTYQQRLAIKSLAEEQLLK